MPKLENKAFSQPTWGTVRGHDIHLACATPEEATVAWGRFAMPSESGQGKDCERCGVSLAEVPDP